MPGGGGGGGGYSPTAMLHGGQCLIEMDGFSCLKKSLNMGNGFVQRKIPKHAQHFFPLYYRILDIYRTFRKSLKYTISFIFLNQIFEKWVPYKLKPLILSLKYTKTSFSWIKPLIMGSPYSAKMSLKDGYGFSGFCEHILVGTTSEYPPPPTAMHGGFRTTHAAFLALCMLVDGFFLTSHDFQGNVIQQKSVVMDALGSTHRKVFYHSRKFQGQYLSFLSQFLKNEI